MAKRSFLLLEVLLGLALLATLGVFLVRLETGAIRQYRQARERRSVATFVDNLLWNWSTTGTAVTLPATGEFDHRLHWRREVRPVRIASGVIVEQISVIVTAWDNSQAREVYRVDWLVPDPPVRGSAG